MTLLGSMLINEVRVGLLQVDLDAETARILKEVDSSSQDV